MYHQIISKVYHDLWCILPEKHRSICRLLESHLAATFNEPKEPLDYHGKPIRKVPEQQGDTLMIYVDGVIGKHVSMMELQCGSCSLDHLCADLKAAADNASVNKIILHINSPGGTVIGLAEAGRLIQAVDAVKPVYAFTDFLCCSAAYWLASQARAIYTTQSAKIGNVGVYAVYLDESRRLEMEGVKINAISSGKDKLMGASWKPMTPEEQARLTARAVKCHEEFKAAILSRRQVADEHLQGWSFDGDDAVAVGIADGIVEDLDQMVVLVGAISAAA